MLGRLTSVIVGPCQPEGGPDPVMAYIPRYMVDRQSSTAGGYTTVHGPMADTLFLGKLIVGIDLSSKYIVLVHGVGTPRALQAS